MDGLRPCDLFVTLVTLVFTQTVSVRTGGQASRASRSPCPGLSPVSPGAWCSVGPGIVSGKGWDCLVIFTPHWVWKLPV